MRLDWLATVGVVLSGPPRKYRASEEVIDSVFILVDTVSEPTNTVSGSRASMPSPPSRSLRNSYPRNAFFCHINSTSTTPKICNAERSLHNECKCFVSPPHRRILGLDFPASYQLCRFSEEVEGKRKISQSGFVVSFLDWLASNPESSVMTV